MRCVLGYKVYIVFFVMRKKRNIMGRESILWVLGKVWYCRDGKVYKFIYSSIRKLRWKVRMGLNVKEFEY